MTPPPVEPPPSQWQLPIPTGPDDLIGLGADLEPGTLLAAYRTGLFPMAAFVDDPVMGWWSPVRRGVLPVGQLKVSRSLRQSCRRFEVRFDTVFDRVVSACADPRRSGAWITDEIAAAYRRLHRLGWAHSVETWTPEGELVGGLYGIAIGGLFAGESMYAHARDASKVALVGLVSRLNDGHAADRLLDTQWSTPHLASLGVQEIDRADYLARLERALALPLPEWG